MNFNQAFKTIIALTLCTLSFNLLAAEMKTPAPDFTSKSANGENFRLSEQRGKIILLNFWASWCGPCRQEMPLLNAMHKKYQDMGFMVVGVNVDIKSEKAKDYLKDTPADFPILFDPESQVSELYRVSAMPSTAIIDRDGNVRMVHAGYRAGDEEKYAKMIQSLLRE